MHLTSTLTTWMRKMMVLSVQGTSRANTTLRGRTGTLGGHLWRKLSMERATVMRKTRKITMRRSSTSTLPFYHSLRKKKGCPTNGIPPRLCHSSPLLRNLDKMSTWSSIPMKMTKSMARRMTFARIRALSSLSQWGIRLSSARSGSIIMACAPMERSAALLMVRMKSTLGFNSLTLDIGQSLASNSTRAFTALMEISAYSTMVKSWMKCGGTHWSWQGLSRLAIKKLKSSRSVASLSRSSLAASSVNRGLLASLQSYKVSFSLISLLC